MEKVTFTPQNGEPKEILVPETFFYEESPFSFPPTNDIGVEGDMILTGDSDADNPYNTYVKQRDNTWKKITLKRELQDYMSAMDIIIANIQEQLEPTVPTILGVMTGNFLDHVPSVSFVTPTNTDLNGIKLEFSNAGSSPVTANDSLFISKIGASEIFVPTVGSSAKVYSSNYTADSSGNLGQGTYIIQLSSNGDGFTVASEEWTFNTILQSNSWGLVMDITTLTITQL